MRGCVINRLLKTGRCAQSTADYFSHSHFSLEPTHYDVEMRWTARGHVTGNM